MKKMRKIISLLLAVVMMFGLVQTPMSVQAAKVRTADDCVKELIVYYKNYQEEAATDIDRLLAELKTLDEAAYEDWKEIMEYWSYVNTEMTVNFGVAPDGLPEDDSLAIVVLGFALNSDGTMKDELIGRLQVGLDSAKKYPNSYIVVTGGGTAADNPNVTEGGLMGEWLIAQGLDPDRVIIENAAPTTVGNALNTYNLLVKNYPQVESVCLITSDYHVPRGCLLFNSKFILAATEAGTKPLNIVANAGYVTGTNGYETVSLQASGVSQVADLSISGVNVALSKVSSLVITQEADYAAGEELILNVVATYNTGFSRDVSEYVTVEGFDAAGTADQTVTVYYTENDVTVSGQVTLKAGTTQIVVTENLEALIEEMEAVDASGYAAGSYQKLVEKVEAAKALLAGGSYTLEQIETAYDEITEAYQSLLKIVNASSKKNVTASCNQDEAYKITDGSASTYWTSKDASGDVQIEDSYYIIDLDGEYELDRIHVTPYNGNSRYYQYDVQVSTDGEKWTTVAENRTTEAATSAGYVHEMEAGVYARYVKVVGVAVHRPDKKIVNFHVRETAVYGVESDNIALGKPVVSSGTDTSVSSSSGSSERTAVDGDRSTYWDGGGYANRPYLTVELGDVYRIDDINVINYWSANNRYYQYEVYTSIDGENFVKVGEKTDDIYAGMYGETYTFEEEVYAAYVKVVGTYNSKNSAFHLNELRVHGEVAAEESYKEYEYNLAKNSLSTLIAEVEATYVEGEYTEETWGALEAAIVNAEALLDDETTALKEFYAAAEVIRAAVEELTYLIFENPEGTVRLASTNLYAKGNTDIPAVFTYFYNRYSVDYVGLQEIDRNTSRNPYDMMEALTTDTRFVDFAFNKNMDFQGGEYGIGILSSTEIKEKSGGLYKQLGSEEQRGWVRSVIEIDGKEVAFYDTHLSTEDEACISNMKEIIKLMDEDPLEYVILTADFNCNREWMYPFLENYNMANGKDGIWYGTEGDDYTDIASSEAYGLDNIITSRNIEVVDFQVIDSMDLSDHNFIYIDFKLLDEEVPSKEYLNIEVTDAKNLEEADYTAESYAVLADALADAEALGDDATQAEINEVLFAIQGAVENLERIYPLISAGKNVTVDGKVESGSAGYVNDGNRYTYMKTAYGNDVIMDLGELYEVDEIQAFLYGKAPRYYHYTLYTSIDGVNYEVYGEKTDNKIADIKVGDVYQKDDCMARYVIMDMTYNSAATGGHAYLSELDVFGAPAEGVADYKAAVRQLIDSYREVDGQEYLPETYDVLKEAIFAAEAVADNADAGLEEVEDAYNTLLEAFEGLDKLADTTELLALIAEVEGMELEGYSSRTVANLNAKLEAAKALCEDVNASQSVVDEAVAKLETAIDLLAAPVNATYKMPLETTENTAMVTLDGIYNLDEIIVETKEDAAYKYQVMVSKDGETWTKAAEQTSDEAPAEGGYVHAVDNSLEVKYVKVESTEELKVSSIYAYGEESNNIALGKPLTFGNSTTGNEPLVVNDGNRKNYWEAGKWASQPWVIIDLEGLYELDSVNVITYWSGTSRYYNYNVYVSTDGVGYELFASRNNTDSVTVYGDTFAAGGEVLARYIMVQGTYNSANSVFHLNEVRAYGEEVVVTPTPEPTPEVTPTPEPKPSVDPADASLDVPVDMYTTSAGSTYNSTDYAIDGSESTHWEVQWDIGATEPDKLWYQIDMGQEIEIQALRYLPRFGTGAGDQNGFVEDYRVEVSADGEGWFIVAEGSWERTGGWKIAEFEPTVARYVRLVGVGTYADVDSNFGDPDQVSSNMAIAEIRVKATSDTIINKVELNKVIAEAKAIDQSLYTTKTVKSLVNAIEAGEELVTMESATQEVVDAAVKGIEKAVKALVLRATAEEKAPLEAKIAEVEAMDVSGYSEETVADLTAAIEAAKEVLADIDATAEDVEDAMEDVEDAVAALAEPTPKPTPEVTPTPDPEPTPEPEDVSEVFPDVKHGAWYEAGVQYVYDNGLMSGSNGLFNPTSDITRAQIVTTLYRLAGEPEVTDTKALTDFADVAEGKYYTDAVCWAYANGIATGNDGKFDPTGKLTRQQMAAFFFRYADVMGMDTTARGDYSSMVNADKVSGYAAEPVAWAVGTGLISGSDVTVNGVAAKDLNPRGNTTRAQVATILMRFCAE